MSQFKNFADQTTIASHMILNKIAEGIANRLRSQGVDAVVRGKSVSGNTIRLRLESKMVIDSAEEQSIMADKVRQTIDELNNVSDLKTAARL